jgi:ABC-type Fe3+-hydroxamate transport system substrate-binding protein
LSIHAIDIDTVADVEPELRRLAHALRLEIEIEPTPPPRPTSGARAFVPIWRRPWMTISGATYAHSMLAHLGIDTVFADASDRYPEVTVDEIIATTPSVVLAPSEPYEFTEKHRAELEAFGPVVFVDGQDLVWWGTRTPSALRRLATALDPYVRT